VAMAERLGVQVWLRGGWAMDFFLGQVTRDHVDIDWEAWNARGQDSKVTVAGGLFAGEPWPDGMLDWLPAERIGSVQCRIISPAVQIECKEMMPVSVPGRPRRPKDAEDVARLRQALEELGRRRPQ
jgi:Aminoglycoside-2''-adenylyltransferase